MINRNSYLMIGWLVVVLSNVAYAEETVRSADAGHDTKTDALSTFDWLTEKRNSWSHGLDYMASSIDGFLAGKDAELQANKSYLRLRLGARWVEDDAVSDDTDFKLRIDLPTTKTRWKLFIENQLDEFEKPGTSSREDLIAPQTEDDSFYGGISRERTTEHWQFRPELGLKLSFPLNPFARFRATRAIELPGQWDGSYQQSFYYFHHGGFGVKGQLSFLRPWGEHYFWRIKTEANWQDETANTSLAQIVSLQQFLSEKAAVVYEVGVLGDTQPSRQISGYYSTVRYRQKLHRDWLFWEVVPAVEWPRAADFEPVYSMTSRIEILFSD